MSPGRITEQSHSGPAPPDRFSIIRWLGGIAATAAIYFVAGKLALLLAVPPGYATAVWPAAGFALGCILLFGNRAWPGVIIGSFLVNFRTLLDTATFGAIVKSVAVPALIGGAAALQALAGAFLVRRFIGVRTALATEKEVARFSLVASASCLITSTVGVTTLWLARVLSSADLLTNWLTWYVGDSIGTLIFAPLVLIWTFRTADWRRKLSVTLPMAFTFAVVVVLFFQTNRWEQGRIKMEFEQRTQNLSQKLQSDFDGYLDVLRSTQNFFASSPAVSQGSFRSFVARDIADHPGIQSLSWNARVPQAKVSAFVEAARRDGLGTFQLTERDAQQKLIPAGPRDEYIVIRYIEPMLGNERALGFNIACDPVRREAFEWSRDEGEARATKQTELIQEKDTAPGFVVYLPVYSNGLSHDTAEERQRRLEGYVGAVFRIADVIAQSLKGVDQNGLELRFLDQNPAPTKQTLFQNSNESAKPAALRMETSIEMAGRKWSLESALSHEYLLAHRAWQSWSVLAIGLLFTGLLGAFLLVVTAHRQRDEVLVAERTHELVAANAMLHREIAERSVAENGLRVSEAKLRSVTHSIGDAIVSADDSGNIVFWNPGAEAIFGYDEKEAIGKPLNTIIPRRYHGMHRETMARLKAGGETRVVGKRVELEGVRKDGAEFPIELTLSSWKTNQGQFYTGILRDITRRKQAEDALKFSESRLAEAQRVAHVGSWEWDTLSKQVFCSEEQYRLFGFVPDEFPASYDRFIASVHQDDQKRVRKWLKKLVAGHESPGIECRIILPNGEIRLLHSLARTVIGNTGKVVRIVGTSQDITERSKADQKFKSLLESAPDAIVIVNGEGSIVLVNSQAEKIFGYQREELLGKEIEVLVPERFHRKDSGNRRDFYKNLRSHEMGAGLDLFGARKDGKEFPIEISLSPLETDEGILAMVAIRDTTDRKLVERELQTAKEEAERANRAKSEFLSRMSHELRTPLNAILGFGQLIEKQSPAGALRTRAGHITGAGRHLLNLINEILDISRIEAGAMQLCLEAVNLADVLHAAREIMRPLAAERGIEFSAPVRIDPPVHVLADLQRFKQVLLNLFSNAVKYSPKKSKVSISYRSAGEGTMRIVISDTGPGIASEKLSRLFTPFDRLGAEQSAVEGTGLGLALSARIMHAMGGGIGASSAIGRGSTFWVDLPRAEPPSITEPMDNEDEPLPDRKSASGKRTILYIEDNLSNLNLVQEILRQQPQVELLSAMQGRLGLDLARKHSPDLILLDIHLPDLNGWEVFSQLRGAETTRNIPVIVISADATPRQIQQFMTAGARDYLTKPLDVTKFSRVIEESAWPSTDSKTLIQKPNKGPLASVIS
jgi:PAS domain S-box-containing protein